MTNRYDLYGKIRWQMTGTKSAPITPEKANPLIQELADRLQNYVFQQGTVKGVLIDLDDAFNLGFTDLECRGGWDIARFDMIDSSDYEDVRAQNYNNVVRVGISRELQSWELSHYKTVLRISKVMFP